MAPGSGECLVRDVKLRSGNFGPVLVTFEHGKLKTEDATELKCGVFTSIDRSKMCTVAAVAEDGDVVYQGGVPKDDGELCHTFLAVRNKRNNKMRLFEASSVRLSPTVASDFVHHFDAQDRKQAHYNLSHAFGSKKSKRVADQKARMEVNVDSVKEKLSSTINDITVKEDNLAPVVDDTFTKLLPPCNREASTPGDVYPISGMLKDKEIGSLEKFYSKSIETGNYVTENFSSFYKYMITSAAAKGSPYVALLLYAETLIYFCNVDGKKMRSEKILCPFSEKVDKRVVKEFAAGGMSRSQSMFDKAVMYIIILSLHIKSFSIDLNIIASCVKNLDMNRVKMLARIIGTVSSSKSGAPTNQVILKVPLPPVQSLMMRSRKSRK